MKLTAPLLLPRIHEFTANLSFSQQGLLEAVLDPALNAATQATTTPMAGWGIPIVEFFFRLSVDLVREVDPVGWLAVATSYLTTFVD